MIVFKRRLLFWLIKAYVKKWGKAIFVSFLLGLVIFFLLKSSLPYIISAFTGVSKQVIGVVGSYTLETLPQSVLHDVSRGLTKIGTDGQAQPDLATSWEIKDGGKTYIFHLRKGLFFQDSTPFTSQEIKTTFTDVSVTRPDNYTIIYHLKDSYAPFLITVARPIFKDNYAGLGEYRIKKVTLNGPFLESLTLASNIATPTIKVYQFYPTQDAVKVAFALGEISVAMNVNDLSIKSTSLTKFPHVTIAKQTNYTQLVTLFYNTEDKDLSDTKLREALAYAMVNEFPEGERAYSSIPPTSWAYQADTLHVQDIDHAKSLISASLGDDPAKYPVFVISTLPRYEDLAKDIQKIWSKIGVQTRIQLVDSLPQVYQIYLGSFNVPKDPDQYTLWHSYQENNISNFNKDKRIDKLLEDGRKTIDKTERVKIYADFQKYLSAEQPASFLYFPYVYTLTRK